MNMMDLKQQHLKVSSEKIPVEFCDIIPRDIRLKTTKA